MKHIQNSFAFAMMAGLLLASETISARTWRDISTPVDNENVAPVNAGQFEQDPLVGAWLINFAGSVDCQPFLDRGNAFFNKEGTLYCACTADLQMAVPTLAPFGAYETHASGLWKRKGERSYKFEEVRILLNKDITPANTACGCQNNYVGTPVAYVVRKSKFKLSKDGQRLKGKATLTFFDLNDMTLQTPVPGLPEIFFEIEGQRVNL